MSRLPWFTQALVGVGLIIFSYWLERRAGDTNLLFFKILGGLLIAYSVFLLIRMYIQRDTSREVDVDEKFERMEPDEQKRIITCQRCGTKHYDKSN